MMDGGWWCGGATYLREADKGEWKMDKRTMTLRWCGVMFVMLVLAGTGTLQAETVFDRECVACHLREKVSLRKAFMNALLVYGGEENMKAGLRYFLRHPRRDSSVMSETFLDQHGVKEPMTLDDATLDKALDIYWERYRVIGNLR